jgi:3' terminal RNA ribose 2'-O-methyltransferase Hen1
LLLTITNTRNPATDLGYLLYKNPAKFQEFVVSFGKAYVFYPAAKEDRCTVAFLLDIDPVALVRGRKGSLEAGPLAQYVNDKLYVASSFLSVAISKVFSTAMKGQCKERPELAGIPLLLEVNLSVLPSIGGENLIYKLFEPLGYNVITERLPLDKNFPEWGESSYYKVMLKATICLSELLTHLYVLIPVLDDEKHYWVGSDEVEKLLAKGAHWLATHPERDLITERYLKHRKSLTKEALNRLNEEENPNEEEVEKSQTTEEAILEERVNLNNQRMEAVISGLRETGAKRILDLGCGEGNLLRLLLKDSSFTEITGMDVSCRSLEIAAARLHLDQLPEKKKDKIKLIQGSLVYRDKRFEGYDAATVIEVIEHLEPSRLCTFERVLFEFAKPETVIITTPNVEYNIKFENLPAGKFRHKDHKFEWNRTEFQTWANGVAKQFGYSVQFTPVGEVDPEKGAPTQLALFSLI